MRRVFHTLLALLCSSGAMAARFDMELVGVDGKPVDGGVVVTLRSTDATRPVAKPAPAIMEEPPGLHADGRQLRYLVVSGE